MTILGMQSYLYKNNKEIILGQRWNDLYHLFENKYFHTFPTAFILAEDGVNKLEYHFANPEHITYDNVNFQKIEQEFNPFKLNEYVNLGLEKYSLFEVQITFGENINFKDIFNNAKSRFGNPVNGEFEKHYIILREFLDFGSDLSKYDVFYPAYIFSTNDYYVILINKTSPARIKSNIIEANFKMRKEAYMQRETEFIKTHGYPEEITKNDERFKIESPFMIITDKSRKSKLTELANQAINKKLQAERKVKDKASKVGAEF